jgi:SSS family solute:Na+ symporter
VLDALDAALFAASLALVMGVGLLAGRHEETSEDFFLASHSIRWWGVAGSIFATNISAHHLVGMLGIGFSIGFAQSHYELGAIFALVLLAYVALPVYAKLRVYTLSQYLAARYDERVALVYSLVTLALIVLQMAMLYYIGSRSMNLLLGDSALAPGYAGGIALLAGTAALYTTFGGLKAVIWTDVLQSLLLLAAGVLVAGLTFSQKEIGGFAGLLTHDAALPLAEQKMHLYLPANHPDLPWTGALTGLIALHVSFWCTNQYIVQRALAARSLPQARVGILTGGFLKLSVPFFSVAGGVAAAQLFSARLPDVSVAPDDAFPTLVAMVVPGGFGLMGVVAAGLLGAILSTLDSLMNSAATLAVVDVYQKHLDPDASETRLVAMGRATIVAFACLPALMAASAYDPASRGNFFLQLSRQISYLTPGIVVAFVLGIAWRRAESRGALWAIAAAPVVGLGLEWGYPWVAGRSALGAWLGADLNFLHRTAATVLACAAIHVFASRSTGADPTPGRFEACGGLRPSRLRRLLSGLCAYLAANATLAAVAWKGLLSLASAGAAAAVFTFLLFASSVARRSGRAADGVSRFDDRLLAGALAAVTTFLLYVFA